MRFPSLHKLHAQKYKTSLSHRFMQCSGKPGRWVIFHIPFCTVSARGATAVLAGVCRPSKFQFTPLREGRQPGESGYSRAEQFQFTPLREGRPSEIQLHTDPLYFNSRPCERGDRPQKASLYSAGNFNSRPCERGDPSSGGEGKCVGIFQFTPLREGRPERPPCPRDGGKISIHAPARGATLQSRDRVNRHRPISIHAPARGATDLVHRRARPCWYFNSRPCERGDGTIKSGMGWRSYFNSRPCERGDVGVVPLSQAAGVFQFTPLREGRPMPE